MAGVSRETIQRALADLTLSPLVVDRLVIHWELLTAWNERTNLTAIREIEEAAWLHYRDSLEALSVIPDSGLIIDMGSGGGFPGLPIAAAMDHREVLLVEPRRKRASFLEAAIARMGLSNARVIAMRAEDPPPSRASAVLTRATFSDPKGIRQCLEWVEEGGVLVAFRSDPGDLEPDKIHRYTLCDEHRYLLIWRKQGQTH